MVIKLKKVTEVPTEGQFIIVWSFEGAVFSGTFRYIGAVLKRYDVKRDRWSACGPWVASSGQTFHYCIVVEDSGHDEDEVTKVIPTDVTKQREKRSSDEMWDVNYQTLFELGIENIVDDLPPDPAKRGGVLLDAHKVINGERQDTYGSPEDSFTLIAHYWNTYITSKQKDNKPYTLTAKDISLMMALFKIAREANQAKRDNLVDAAGYIGIAADLYVKPQENNVE